MTASALSPPSPSCRSRREEDGRRRAARASRGVGAEASGGEHGGGRCLSMVSRIKSVQLRSRAGGLRRSSVAQQQRPDSHLQRGTHWCEAMLRRLLEPKSLSERLRMSVLAGPCSMSVMYAGYPSPSPPPISPPAHPPLRPTRPAIHHTHHTRRSSAGNCSAGYEHSPESRVNGGCMVVAWVVYVPRLRLLLLRVALRLLLQSRQHLPGGASANRHHAHDRPGAAAQSGVAVRRGGQRRSSLGMRRGSQREKETTPARRCGRSRSPTRCSTRCTLSNGGARGRGS